MKLIIAGTRDFNDFDLLKRQVDEFLKGYDPNDIEIVSGTARGADRLGETYATLRGFPIKKFPAQWNIYGRSAGYRRNEQMAKYASHCIVFWDGQSRGTQHMINLAREHNLILLIVHY